MKKVNILLLGFCVIFSFISNGQERNDEARQKLKYSMDSQSEKLINIPGWSRMENQDGKFWKQTENYLACCENFKFEYMQTYKFSLEGGTFYLFTVMRNERLLNTYAFTSSSLKRLEAIINAADGQSYSTIDIRYCDVFADDKVKSFNPELAIQNKEMIRLLLIGEGSNVLSNYCKGDSLFKIKSQIIKGETIVRFQWKSSFVNPFDENYFELKKSDFEKLFKFTPYENENKYIKQGDEKSESKDYAGAISEYTNAIRLNPNNPEQYNSRGVTRYRLNNFSGALEDFSKAIELCPTEKTQSWNFQISPEVIANYYLNRADCKLQLIDYKGVLEDITKSSYWFIPTDRSMFLSGQANYGLENYSAAVSDFSRAIFDNGNNGNYYFRRGLAYLLLKDYNHTITDFSKVLELYPQTLDAYYYRAISKKELKDYEGALSDCNKAIEIDAKYAQAYSMRAFTKNSLQDYSGAIIDSNKALEINPNYGGALSHRGLAKIKLGQKESGCADLSKSVELGYVEAKELLLQYCK